MLHGGAWLHPDHLVLGHLGGLVPARAEGGLLEGDPLLARSGYEDRVGVGLVDHEDAGEAAMPWHRSTPADA
eukprot:10849686-Alexandrium_andersonii.AAC.1